MPNAAGSETSITVGSPPVSVGIMSFFWQLNTKFILQSFTSQLYFLCFLVLWSRSSFSRWFLKLVEREVYSDVVLNGGNLSEIFDLLVNVMVNPTFKLWSQIHVHIFQINVCTHFNKPIFSHGLNVTLTAPLDKQCQNYFPFTWQPEAITYLGIQLPKCL